MGSSQRTRLIIFSAFLVLLIVFAALYRPVDAMRRPAPQNVMAQGE